MIRKIQMILAMVVIGNVILAFVDFGLFIKIGTLLVMSIWYCWLVPFHLFALHSGATTEPIVWQALIPGLLFYGLLACGRLPHIND